MLLYQTRPGALVRDAESDADRVQNRVVPRRLPDVGASTVADEPARCVGTETAFSTSARAPGRGRRDV